jgi:hypothetical protein
VILAQRNQHIICRKYRAADVFRRCGAKVLNQCSTLLLLATGNVQSDGERTKDICQPENNEKHGTKHGAREFTIFFEKQDQMIIFMVVLRLQHDIFGNKSKCALQF